MKSPLWCIAAFILAVSSLAGRATAQTCITLSDDLAAYTDESTDGTYIYTSVEIDGPEEMIIAPSCAPDLPQFYHTPRAYNLLTTPEGASVGGWASGDPLAQVAISPSQTIRALQHPRGSTLDSTGRWRQSAAGEGNSSTPLGQTSQASTRQIISGEVTMAALLSAHSIFPAQMETATHTAVYPASRPTQLVTAPSPTCTTTASQLMGRVSL